MVRQQWQSEPTLHGVRDVTCEEDRSQVRWGRMPPHRHRLDALGRGDAYRGGLPPCCGAAVGGFSPARHQTRQLHGPAYREHAKARYSLQLPLFGEDDGEAETL